MSKNRVLHKFKMSLTRGTIYKTLAQGKTEIPIEEWTEKELCWMMSGCLKESRMGRLSDMPGIILRAMKKCGVDEGKRGEVLRRILNKMVGFK